MTYALIGCGRIAANHMAAAIKNRFGVAAVCDVVPGRMDALLERHGPKDGPAVARYEDYGRMLEEVKPNVAAIATESGSHARIALDCIEAGCNVIIEKPMALSVSDADAVIDLAARKKAVVSVCHQNRFNKSVQKMREALEGGRFGKLSHIAAHVRWNRGEEYYRQAPWRGKWASDGGCLMNQCIHNADLMHWMLGDVEEVFAYARNASHPYIEGEDLGLALVRAKSGALGLFEGTVNVFPKNLEETLYLFGEKGTVKAAGTSVNLIEEWSFADSADDPEAVKEECRELPPNVYGFGHARLYEDVISAIETRRKPLVDGREGKRALELILAMYKSKKTGLPVSLPLDGFASADMEGTF
jgi:predicted dehydrogenase